MPSAGDDRCQESGPAGVPGSKGKPWGYAGNIGPAYWGSLDPAYVLCASGAAQSPIDLTAATRGPVPTLTLRWGTLSPVRLLNTGHTLQVVAPPGPHLLLGDVAYRLTQFHFHTPSEHHLDGVVYPMELHFVHVTADGAVAVLGVVLREGADHPGLELLFAQMPGTADDLPGLVEVDATLELTTLLPDDRTTFRYSGSLTTPPCTEGVDWVVFAEPITLGRAQLATYQAVFAPDARPVQPRNGRLVRKGV